MLKFVINAISKGLGFTKTEARGTLILIFIILIAIFSSQAHISYLKNQSIIAPDSSAIAWINEVHNAYSIKERERSIPEQWLAVKDYTSSTKVSEPTFNDKDNDSIESRETLILDINTASAEDLQRVKGIGATYSERIVKYRELLGGFSDTTQLYEVYGLKESTIKNLLNSFRIDSPVKPLEINVDSVSHLAKHPYISYDLARVIVNYRKEHGNIQSADELLKIKAIDERTFLRLKPYLE